MFPIHFRRARSSWVFPAPEGACPLTPKALGDYSERICLTVKIQFSWVFLPCPSFRLFIATLGSQKNMSLQRGSKVVGWALRLTPG